MKKSGRPSKSENNRACKDIILSATIELIQSIGADAVTVRKVCEKADVSIGTFYHYFQDRNDLMMAFVREESFDGFELLTQSKDMAGRQTELYMHLISRYQALGRDFMKQFYTTDNQALSAYMDEADGTFADGTVMARSETELGLAREQGYMLSNMDIHVVAMDICTIVKGCVFEWCLTKGQMDIRETLERIIKGYLTQYSRL